MTDLNLTQAEADALIAMEKLRIDDRLWDYPGLGGTLIIPLVSVDRRGKFPVRHKSGEDQSTERKISE
jgi:hypothetical protein